MQLIAVLSQKGGGGKTTVSTNLAVASAQAGVPTLLLDLDPQQSALRWGSWRERKQPKTKAPLIVQAASLENIAEKIEAAKSRKVKLVIMDTPPAASTEANLAARAAQLVLVVVQPSILDLSTLTETFSLKWVATRPAFVVFNRAPTAGATLSDARRLVEGQGYRTYDGALHDRSAYRTAPIDGLGVSESDAKSQAATEVKSLYTWAKGLLGKTAAPDPLRFETDDLLGELER